jgi:hypothetical protein
MTKRIGFAVSPETSTALSTTYRSLFAGAKRAIESWPFLRDHCLSEMKKFFSVNELSCMVQLRKNIRFNSTMISGEMLIFQLQYEEKHHNIGKTFNCDIAILCQKIEQLAYAHAFFLFDWCDCYWRKNYKLEEYVKELL